MNTSSYTPPAPGMNLGDIYYVLFRHKWKILACAALGLVTALSLHTVYRPPFQSEAKLFVRYVISDGKAVGPGAVDSTSKSPDQRGETIMASETEILSSADLAQQVVQAIGAERILAKVNGGKETSLAVRYIRENLSVRVPQGSSVIHIIFRHPDSEVVQPVLREVVDRYLKMHVEIHRAAGMLGDLFSQERDRLRSRLADTEEELRKVRNRAGVISIEDAKKSYTEQISELRQQIFRTQAELAERTSILDSLSQKEVESKGSREGIESGVNDELRDQYMGLAARIQYLTKREQELLTQFTSDNGLVKETRAQLLDAQNGRRRLIAANPQLAKTELSSTGKVSGADAFDPVTATAQIAALKSRLSLLTTQLSEVRADAAKIDQLEGTMSELKLQKELQESNYRYFSAGLEQTRINETLGSGRVSNISQIQTPSAPFIDTAKTEKVTRVLGVGGLVLGLAWAFAIELFFDRSVKRAIDVERLTKYPLLLTIPALSRKQLKRAGSDLALMKKDDVVGAETNLLHTFHETLRDRLISYFDSKGLTHKPKLVAVSSMNKNAGTTTTAAGLARSLSETGEGNVLLVDMTGGQGSAQHFVKGKAVCGLDEMFSERDSAHVQENLYVVEANNKSDRLYKNLPQRFSKLVPKLKASDFDYVIFDMPPVSQISITPRLAGFMDMVLLVVESEKTDRDIVLGGTALLAESRAHVAVVLNKTKSYVPRRLQQELLSS